MGVCRSCLALLCGIGQMTPQLEQLPAAAAKVLVEATGPLSAHHPRASSRPAGLKHKPQLHKHKPTTALHSVSTCCVIWAKCSRPQHGGHRMQPALNAEPPCQLLMHSAQRQDAACHALFSAMCVPCAGQLAVVDGHVSAHPRRVSSSETSFPNQQRS